MKTQFEEPSINACNLNLYQNGAEYLDLHADDELLFPDKDGKCTILSLSLGATRKFIYRSKCSRDPSEIDLTNGDIVIMCGNFQKFYKHGLARSKEPVGGRINMTFRSVLNHDEQCIMAEY